MGAIRIHRPEAADLGLGRVGRTRIHDIVSMGRARYGRALLISLPGAVCLLLIAIEQFHPLTFQAPELGTAIETAITLSAFSAAFLFGLSVGHRRNLETLLLAGALLELAVIDFVSYVLPAAMDMRTPRALSAAPVLGRLFMAMTLVAAASIKRDPRFRAGRKPFMVMVTGSLCAAAIAELGGVLLRSDLASRVGIDNHGVRAAAAHPTGVILAVTTATLLAVAAIRTAGRDRSRSAASPLLLAMAMVCFAGASLTYLVLPAPGVDAVTVREVVFIVAWALVLAAALRQEAAARRAIAVAAAAGERRRIARDLHDGLAQDLAFIAAHAARIAREAGEDNPLVIAARRALAVSRGAIADLSAAEASSPQAALRQISNELEVRFGVHVSVDAEEADLEPGAREEVIRIVREAIVNAAKADARNISVSLAYRDDWFVLRVVDDGVGIDTELKARPGFGVRAMRERAASLGGDLAARHAPGGGTELEVVFR